MPITTKELNAIMDRLTHIREHKKQIAITKAQAEIQTIQRETEAYGQMRVARYGYKEYDWWVDGHDCVLSKDHYTEVTHWMPLTQPPKGE